jgi:hypothetical protein
MQDYIRDSELQGAKVQGQREALDRLVRVQGPLLIQADLICAREVMQEYWRKLQNYEDIPVKLPLALQYHPMQQDIITPLAKSLGLKIGYNGLRSGQKIAITTDADKWIVFHGINPESIGAEAKILTSCLLDSQDNVLVPGQIVPAGTDIQTFITLTYAVNFDAIKVNMP